MAGALRCGAGGIEGLVALLDEHCEAVQWDLAHYWPGRSIYELYRGEMTWQELRVFLRYLPPESSTAQAIWPKTAEELERERWSAPADRFMLASLIDSVREQTYVQVKLHGDPKKTRHLKPPEPIERPGVQGRTKTIRFGGKHGSGAAQLAEVFGAPKAS